MGKIGFYSITQAQYDALAEKDADTLYFTTDSHRQFKGQNEIQPSGSVATDDVTIEIPAGEIRYNLYAFGVREGTWNGEYQIKGGSAYGVYCMGATINMTSGYICNAVVTAKTDGQKTWEGGLQVTGGTAEHVIVEGGHMYLYGSTARGFDIEVKSGALLMISDDAAVGEKILVRAGGRLQLYKGSALRVHAEDGAILSIEEGTVITYE